jgi:hypothetical protein
VNPGGEIRGQILPPNPAVGVGELAVALGDHEFVAAPNPVPNGGSVALFYTIPRAGHVSVDVYDAAGRLVRRVHDANSAATGILAWDTRDDAGTAVAAGVYFARLTTETGSETNRVVVLR